MIKKENLILRLSLIKEKLKIISRNKSLPPDCGKDIACVCCYFNSCSYKSKLKNYRIFYEGIKRTGVKLLTVELVFGDDDFELSEFDDVLQLRTGKENIMWQKERLLNIGIQKLIEEGYNKIAWLDADIVFENDGWVEDLSNALDKYPVVHGFELIKRIDGSGMVKDYYLSSVKKYYEAGKLNVVKSLSGGVWAAQAEVLGRVPLYDYGILGGGDSYLFFGCFYHNREDWIDQIKREPLFKLSSKPFVDHYFRWAWIWGSLIKGRIAYLNHSIKLHHHGSFVNRQYAERHDILKKHNFNPEIDIKLGKNQVWEWASDKPGLHKEVKDYFYDRREDD